MNPPTSSNLPSQRLLSRFELCCCTIDAVRPNTDSELSEFFGWLTHPDTMRWHAHYQTQGIGHLYQGRFKAFHIEEDHYLLTVMRYAERNALRANLVENAEDWKYSSLWRRQNSNRANTSILAEWQIPDLSNGVRLSPENELRPLLFSAVTAKRSNNTARGRAAHPGTGFGAAR